MIVMEYWNLLENIEMEKEMEKEKNIFLMVKLLFESEYLNGKKWNGKGKEYDFIGNVLKSEIEYLNGEKKVIIKY